MKNKVLRLAIVAVLVVAMVLSMAACTPTKPVDPSPSPAGPSPSAPVVTSPSAKPSVAPVGTDEAVLNEKYGITFPVAEDMKVDFVPAPTASPEPTDAPLHVVSGDKKVAITFGAKKPAYNDAFNAYKDNITITAKVTGLTKEGGKIELEEVLSNDGEAGKWASYVPKAAGTYTVTYTVKVSTDGEATYGFFKPAKVNETYTVVKTYEVAKKAITIEAVSDSFLKANSLSYPVAKISYGATITAAQKKAIDIELKTFTGNDQKYNLSVDILSADLTNYGAYPLNLVCTLAGKSEKVDVSTLVAPNFDVTFKNGNRYVPTVAEMAAAVAAVDDVAAAAKTAPEELRLLAEETVKTANKETILLGLATYNALSDASKAYFVNTDAKDLDGKANLANLLAMEANNKNLPMISLADEARALVKTWNDKLQNAEDGKAFVTFMLGLTAKQSEEVTKILVGDANANKTNEALGLVTLYTDNLAEEFTKAKDAYETAALAMNADKIEKALVDGVVKAQAALEKAFAALTPSQQNAKAKGVLGIASALTKELSARYTAYMTLVTDLDAYTNKEKVTYGLMTEVLAYDFDARKIENRHAQGVKNAAWYVFDTDNQKDDFVFWSDFIIFSTPLQFINETVASYKSMVGAIVTLDAAIASAQKDVISTLGSEIQYAVAENAFYTGFNGTTLLGYATDKTETAKYTGLEALQAYIAEKAIALAADPDDGLFLQMGKKDLATLIASALKECVSEVNAYIKDTETSFPEVKAIKD